MSLEDIIQAWKDPDHRDDDVEHPAGEITLDTQHVGGQTEYLVTIGCCEGFTSDREKCFGTYTQAPNCGWSMLACG